MGDGGTFCGFPAAQGDECHVFSLKLNRAAEFSHNSSGGVASVKHHQRNYQLALQRRFRTVIDRPGIGISITRLPPAGLAEQKRVYGGLRPSVVNGVPRLHPGLIKTRRPPVMAMASDRDGTEPRKASKES